MKSFQDPLKVVRVRQLPGDDWTMADQLAKARRLRYSPWLEKREISRFKRQFPLNIERAACTLFGIVTRSVDMTVYTHVEGKIMLWTLRHAKTKSTYLGMLDSTVAGGVASGEMPFEYLVREAAEEATLPADIAKQDAKACGTVSWFQVKDAKSAGELGLL